jgi:protease I
MSKILILTGDAAETLEVFYPYQRLLEAGYEVHIGAPEKKKLQFVVHDFVAGFDTYTEKLGHMWDADVAFKDVNPADYVAIVVPGGRAPEYRRTPRSPRSATGRCCSRPPGCCTAAPPRPTRR